MEAHGWVQRAHTWPVRGNEQLSRAEERVAWPRCRSTSTRWPIACLLWLLGELPDYLGSCIASGSSGDGTTPPLRPRIAEWRVSNPARKSSLLDLPGNRRCETHNPKGTNLAELQRTGINDNDFTEIYVKYTCSITKKYIRFDFDDELKIGDVRYKHLI